MQTGELFLGSSTAGLSGGVFAQSLQGIQQRDANQQPRIENSLQDGAFTARDAATLSKLKASNATKPTRCKPTRKCMPRKIGA